MVHTGNEIWSTSTVRSVNKYKVNGAIRISLYALELPQTVLCPQFRV